jgi:hypothetical protein
MATGNIKQAFEYARENPNSEFTKNFIDLASTGCLDQAARVSGLDLTMFKSKYLTKDQVKDVVETRPQNTTKEEIIDGLVGRGYILQGYNEPDCALFMNVNNKNLVTENALPLIYLMGFYISLIICFELFRRVFYYVVSGGFFPDKPKRYFFFKTNFKD